MEYKDVVMGRRSIRGYQDKPVSKETITEVLEMAMRAPTSLNTQPWNFYVVTGEPLDRIRAGNVERNLAGVPDTREFRKGPGYEGAHRERQIEIAIQLFQAMGIERHDKEKRQDWVLRGFRQYDAPVSVVVIMICVAMGWPDESFPANAVVSKRKPVEDGAVFVGFD